MDEIVNNEAEKKADELQYRAGENTYFGIVDEQAEQMERKERAACFARLGLPCLLHAVIFVVCLYENPMGVTMPIWIALLSGLVVTLIRSNGRDLKKGSNFIIGAMLLIGISTFLTGNYYIVFMNYAAELLLLVSLLLHNYADDNEWDFGKYIVSIIVAIFMSIGRLFAPLTDCSAYIKEKSNSRNGRTRAVIIGIVIAIPSLVILGALLSSADMVFADVIKRTFSAIVVPEKFFSILFMLVFGFFATYCGIKTMESSGGEFKYIRRRNGEPLTAITVTAMIAVMYLIFSVVQIMYLFIGGFTLPDGVTYAEYARKGFFELLCVCVINLCIVLIIKKYVKENKILNAVLIVISSCTYIMIASSTSRMIMYIREYHLTFLRVFVLVALFTLAILLTGVIIYIVKESFPFFRFGLAVVSVIYILFAFSHADYFIAEYNLNTSPDVGEGAYTWTYSDEEAELYFTEGRLDFDYLSGLSTDAAPAIAKYLEEAGLHQEQLKNLNWYRNYLYGINADLDNALKVRKFNVSFFIANRVLEIVSD